jgi:hypothetical protein
LQSIVQLKWHRVDRGNSDEVNTGQKDPEKQQRRNMYEMAPESQHGRLSR